MNRRAFILGLLADPVAAVAARSKPQASQSNCSPREQSQSMRHVSLLALRQSPKKFLHTHRARFTTAGGIIPADRATIVHARETILPRSVAPSGISDDKIAEVRVWLDSGMKAALKQREYFQGFSNGRT
jgi:hypothetical protein